MTVPHKFVLMDGNNLFHRQANMTDRSFGIDSMIGMSMHMILNSMKKEFTNFKASHAVFFTEGRSWRKDVYPGYKANRTLMHAQKTQQEQEDSAMLIEAFSDLTAYIDTKTNISMIQHPQAEADDMIHVWIEMHPNDEHILISTDSDFIQLLRFPNVTIYDPVRDILIRRDGVFSDNGKEERLAFTITSDAKIKVGKPDPNFVPEPDWYEFALFLKCIRGDKGDNIFTAYPKVRVNGTRNTVGIREAYLDRETQGYAWTNFMQQRWVDHESVEHVVKDKYQFNRKLIDLTQIPDELRTKFVARINETTGRKNVPAPEIGMGFMKFCKTWDLQKIGAFPEQFMPMMKSKYSVQ